MFKRAALIGFSGVALVACSGVAGTKGGLDAPVITGGDGGGATCDMNPVGDCYPAADWGTNRAAFSSRGVRTTAGSTMRNYKWFGFKTGAIDRGVANLDDNLKTVSLADYYDPKGTRGIKVIHLVASSRWCSVCSEETKNYLVKNHATDTTSGIVVLQTMIDGLRQGVAATSKDLDAWSASTGIFVAQKDADGVALKTGSLLFTLALDPDNKNFGPFFDGAGVPWNGWIDARTMEIIDYAVGFNPAGDAAAVKYVGANTPKGQ